MSGTEVILISVDVLLILILGELGTIRKWMERESIRRTNERP